MDLPQAQALADRLIGELDRRVPEMERLTNYYRGEHPLKFASSEFAAYFTDRYKGFSDNWCQVVADSPVERLTTIGIQPYGSDQADADLWRVWMENNLDADSQLGYQASINCSRSFALVWGDPPVVTFEDPRQTIVAYRPGSRRDRVAALKTWQDGSRQYATLYLPDEVWKLERGLPRDWSSPDLRAAEDLMRQWQPRETGDEPNPQPNPMGIVPVVELPNRPMLGEEPLSDTAGVTAMQDAINLLWSQLFTAGDYASLPQRVVLGADMPKMPILDSNGVVTGYKPIPLEQLALDRVLWIEDENAKLGNWPAADLSAYTDVLEVAVGHIAAQTRTPQHYLVGKMANLSGDALIAAETGLVKRAEEKQLWLGAGEREMFRLIALAQGASPQAAAAVAAGRVLWTDVEYRSISQLTDSLLKLRQIGFPFEFLARRYGLTPTEVADLMRMREREAEIDPISQALNGRPEPGALDEGGQDGDA